MQSVKPLEESWAEDCTVHGVPGLVLPALYRRGDDGLAHPGTRCSFLLCARPGECAYHDATNRTAVVGKAAMCISIIFISRAY